MKRTNKQGMARAVSLSRIESGVRAATAFYEALRSKDTEEAAGLFSPDCALEGFGALSDGAAGSLSIKQNLREVLALVVSKLEAGQVEIEELFGVGGKAVLRWKYSAADFAGQARGSQATVRGVTIFKVENDLIREITLYTQKYEG